MAIGGWWLWQNQLLLLWLSITASCSGIAWIVARLLKRHKKNIFIATQSKPNAFNSQRDQKVWGAVQALAEQIKQDKSFKYAQPDNWLEIGRRVLAVVAKQYRPNARNPELEIPLTELLSIVEHVTHDMHQQLSANIPFSHVITLADGLNLQRWLDNFHDGKKLFRLGRMLVNPLSGFLNEANGYSQDNVVDMTLPYLQNWLLDTYIQKVGEYAILLYSGRMAVASEKIEAITPESRQDSQQALAQQDSLECEPLRIVVVGQTNAGKSTLINTLFDKPVAAADVVSTTAELMPYKLEREGLVSGLIFDTPGYSEQSNWLKSHQKILDQADLVLLVCSANNAARLADRGFLDAFHKHFSAQAIRKFPPVICVVTHIDQLRPSREWQPPYDLNTPNCAKAQNIQAALFAIQRDLALSENTVLVPVSLIENEGQGVYNVESLIHAMGQHMDEARRARLLRCLKAVKGREKWPQLWRQVGNSGRWLFKKAGNAVNTVKLRVNR
jgi:predicted GTPase